jgi:DMSO/TMAO reductase YedYZ molybdopterin-dependent catalytic subunit
LITPTGELFVTSYSSAPRVDPAAWSLTVDGLVDRPLTLTYADLASFPKVESVRTLECIGNPVGGSLIGNPRWSGFLAQEIWDRVGIRPEAIRAKFTSADGYQTSVDLRWITQPDVLLVTEINGEPLPAAHGFPLRILMPGLYGQKMPKWLTRIEFIPEVFIGYWEGRGWSDEASVRTNSIIRQPRGLGALPPGAVPVFGVAFAGLRGITAVEIRIDEGDWQPAQLVQDPSPLVWTQWSFDWPAEAGAHRIAVRATDETGFVQNSDADTLLAGAFPDGTDDIHSVVVQVEA